MAFLSMLLPAVLDFLAKFLANFIPLALSEKPPAVGVVSGIPGLDAPQLNKVNGLTAAQLPAFLIGLVCLFGLSGCLGNQERIIYVEPGGISKVATNRKIPVTAKDDQGNDQLEQKNIGGYIIMPSSVYGELRKSYMQAHPAITEEPTSGTNKDKKP